MTSGATPDPVLAEILEAVERSRTAPPEASRARFRQLWDGLGAAADPYHRCVLAHFAADVAADLDDELAWDEAALAAAGEIGAERAGEVAAFLPSLHGSLADDHRRLGDLDRARAHLASARDHLPLLADDDYGRHVRAVLHRIAADLGRA